MESQRGAPRTDVITVAAVEASSAYLDRQSSVDRAVEIIREAGQLGVQFLVFPEGFIPAHPVWFHFYPDSHRRTSDLNYLLVQNAVTVPSPEMNALSAAIAEAHLNVVIGVAERPSSSESILYNTQLVFGPDGKLIWKHRKLMPTMGERLIHTPGFGDTFGTFEMNGMQASALICGENGNPLALFALTAEQTRIHAMSWPPMFNQNVTDMPDLVRLRSRAFAATSRCFVVSACGVVDDSLRKLVDPDGQFPELTDPCRSGGSLVVAPSGRVLTDTVDPRSSCLVLAAVDLSEPVQQRIYQDVAGGYNRPDVFHLEVNRHGHEIISFRTPVSVDPDNSPSSIDNLEEA